MKSWIKVIVLVLLAISVSGCSSAAQKPQTALELVNMMENELAKVESYSTDLSTKLQYVNKADLDGFAEEITLSQKMNKINHPLNVFIDMNMKMNTINEDTILTRYFVNEELYEFKTGEWAKRTEAEVEQFKQLMEKEKSILSYIIKNYNLDEKDIDMSKEGNNYIIMINLSLEGDSNQAADLEAETVQKMKDENTKKYATTYTIDGKTLLPIKSTTEIVAEEDRYGIIYNRVSNNEITYSNYNKVEKISLPKEAESAKVKPYVKSED